MSPETVTIRQRVQELGPWFHDLDLEGVRTAPDHPLGDFIHELWATVESAFPADLTGKTVLDVGCNAGFYSFRMAERGAAVTGVDHNPRYLEQGRFAADVLGHEVEFLELDAYDVGELGRSFDYVIFMGVLYHLRYPLLALDRMAALVRERMIVQSLVRGAEWRGGALAEDYPITEKAVFREPGFPGMYFIEHRYAGDPTNWWVTNEEGLAAMLRSAGLEIQEHPGPGVYFCGSERGD